ncbi:hypothetical protein EV644_1161, partial [Kribbella orskensis]
SLFFGAGQHLSPLAIGVRLLFINGVTAVANPLVGRLLTRWPPLALLAAGLALGSVAMFLLTGMQTDTSIGAAAWRLAILGVADAFMLTAVAVTAINAVPQHLAGMAAATNTALRQYGAVLGPAVLGVILASRIADGASMTSALHTALIVNGVLLAIAAIVCAMTLRLGPNTAS